MKAELTGSPPGFPIPVMEPVALPEPFNDTNYLFQLKWDGLRMLARLPGEKGRIEFQNRRGHIRTSAYPELNDLSLILDGRRAILDGEIVVLRDGRPSFQAVMRRELADPDASILRTHPIHYMIFDLLWLDDQDLRKVPIEERLRLLKSLLQSGPRWELVESRAGEGRRLFEAVRAEGLEGIVAKRLGSLYVPGKKSGAWIKVKCFRLMPCVVGGYTLKGPRPSALMVGAYREKELIYLGRVGSGITQSDLDRMAASTASIRTDHSPFSRFPRIEGAQFLKPILVGRVKYLEWTAEGLFRAPVWEGFSDLSPEECHL